MNASSVSAGDEPTPAGSPEGRDADRPGKIPWRGWKSILVRVKDQLLDYNLSVVAAGVAFYSLLALFPAIAVLVSVYGMAFDPADVRDQITALVTMMPAQAAQLIQQQIQAFVSRASEELGLAALAGLAVMLWSATAGVKTLFIALNIVYDEEETRGFIRFNLLAIGMTFGGILFAVLAFACVVALPVALGFIGLGGMAELAISALRWPVLALGVITVLAVLYRFGPDRKSARWRWLSWGAVSATLLWLAASVVFSFYISNFADYDKAYGSLGAVVILMMWIYISAYIVLLGAELNAEIEHQTAIDSTTGPPKPMGKRGAYVADTLG